MPVAIVPVITWDWIDIPRAAVAVRQAQSRSFPGVSWKAVIRWLMIARQEAVSVPAWRRPFMNRRSRRDDRQQRQDDSNRQKHEARHQRTIDGRLLRGDSNLGARCSAAASCETTASRSQSSKKYLRRPKLGDVRSVRRWICSFLTPRTMHIHLGCPKNEPAANDDRVAMASTWATVAWINSHIL